MLAPPVVPTDNWYVPVGAKSVPAFVADAVPAPARFTTATWKPKFGKESAADVCVPVILILYAWLGI